MEQEHPLADGVTVPVREPLVVSTTDRLDADGLAVEARRLDVFLAFDTVTRNDVLKVAIKLGLRELWRRVEEKKEKGALAPLLG